MLVAVPSEAPGGLDAKIADHFGHCDVFTLVQLEDQEVGPVEVVPNVAHEEGGCMGPVMLLKKHSVEALVAGGMGMRPLSGFQEVGIKVYFKEETTTVQEAVLQLAAGECREFGDDQTCGGHGHCGHGHAHAPVMREVVDGPIGKDRVGRVSYRLTDADGELLDESSEIDYLHGSGQIVPGLEKALEGLEAGAKVSVTLAPEDAYGEHDDGNVVEVPSEQLPEGAEPGMVLQVRTSGGGVVPVVLASIDGPKASLDANHPLAGKTLTFDVEVLQVFAASPEELEHGHVH